jgi:hypothetical protein
MARVIGRFFLILWKLTPWILKLVWDVLNVVLRTLQNLIQGVHPQAEKIATRWTREVIQSRDLPNIWATRIYTIFYGLVIFSFVGFWILHAWLILRILQLLFS